MKQPLLLEHDEVRDGFIPWEDLLDTVLRRYRLVLTLTLAGFTLVTLYALIRPPMYRASARLLVTPARVAYAPVSANDQTPAVVASDTSYRASEPEMNSTAALLRRPELIREVLASEQEPSTGGRTGSDLKRVVGFLADIVLLPDFVHNELHGVREMSSLDRQVEKTSRRLQVSPVPNSNLIQISFEHPNATWASQFINRLIDLHMEPKSRSYEKDNTLTFFQQQRVRLSDELEAAQAALSAFHRKNGTEALFENETELRTIRLQLESERASLANELAGINAKIESLSADIDHLPERLALGAQVERDDTVQLLKAQIARMELDRSALLAKFDSGSLAVRELDRQIADANKLLATERKSSHATQAALAPANEELVTQLVRARADAALVDARLSSVEQEISSYRGKLDRLEDVASERKRLESRLAAAEGAYSTYVKKEEEARFADEMHDSHVADFSIAERATVPPAPEPSRTTLLILFGTVFSTFCGIGLAFFLNRLDPSVNSVTDARYVVGLAPMVLLWEESE